jgi:hypothetical protein
MPPSFLPTAILLSIELIEAAENGFPRSFMIRALNCTQRTKCNG